MSNIIMGCDPEFRIKENDTPIPASSILSSCSDTIGVDGHSSTGELRPGTFKTPEEGVAKLHTCLATLSLAYPQYTFYGGTMIDGAPIGGHLHLGKYAKLAKTNIGPWITNQQDYLHKIADWLHMLNDATSPAEPRQARRERGYGTLYEMRQKDSEHIEFREPHSWLRSPDITLLFFATLYAIAHQPRLTYQQYDNPTSALIAIYPHANLTLTLSAWKQIVKRALTNTSDNINFNWKLSTKRRIN